MAGVVGLIIFFIILAARRSRGEPIQLPPTFWLWCLKSAQLIVLLTVFGATDTVGKTLVAPAFIVLFAPSFVLARIVVPLGLPRVAYWAARCFGPIKLIRETGAGAAVYGALALVRRPPSTQTIDWLEQRVNRARSLRGAGVVAAGLLAALRADRHRARCLLLVADTSPRKFIPNRVRAIARDWLVADAARIGNWPEVIRLGRRGAYSLRWSYALARIGERLAGDPKSCRDWQLWLFWMVAPRRRATLPLLRRALAVPRAPVQAAAEPPVAVTLPDALAALAHVLEDRFAHDGGSLARSVCGVDAAIELPATRALVQQRLQALGAFSGRVEAGSSQNMRPPEDSGAQHDVDAVISGVRKRLVDLVVPIIEEASSLASGHVRGPVLDQAVEQARARLFSDVEAQCKDYSDRYKRESSLDSNAEWRAWAVMRDQAERLLELAPESENALFHAMYIPACNFAVFQHNKCIRRFLAHEIYSWLHRHCRGDPAASKLLSGNMRASAS